MFGREQIRKLQQTNKRQEQPIQTSYNGPNRRAVAMLPGPVQKESQSIPLNDPSGYRQLLLSIEANQSSCCLRISSPRCKSRSAVLVFRGRALGCIYGSKKYVNQLFGQEAYQHIMADIAQPGNFIDAYYLNEEIVLAAGALFYGEIFHGNSGTRPEVIFEAAYQRLINAKMPGCIVVNDHNNLPVCIVYIFAGRNFGVFSHKDGWLNTQYESALKYVVRTKDAKVAASMLAAKNTQEVQDITFSLSGLADRSTDKWTGVLRYELTKSLFLNYSREITDKRRSGKALSTFISQRISPAVHLNQAFVSKGIFKLRP